MIMRKTVCVYYTHTYQKITIEIGIKEKSETSSLKYHHSEKLARVENQFLKEIYDGKILTSSNTVDS